MKFEIQFLLFVDQRLGFLQHFLLNFKSSVLSCLLLGDWSVSEAS
jgi:hypothetical protein